MLEIRLVIWLVLLSAGASAQSRFVISGTVKDANTGEDLIGATIVVPELPNTGTVTNQYGFYSLTLPKGSWKVHYQFVGYEPTVFDLDLSKDVKQDILLAEKSYEIGHVVVTGERADRNVSSPDMGNVKISPKEIENIPVIFGERDILKTIQLTPGVKSAGEGNSGFYVRGGGIDQNLILLDEAPVYNASHLLGFFSVFNSDAIRDASLYKGSVPAEYGGRASSVFDIRMKEGNIHDYAVNGSAGLISSNLTVEGPVIRDKSSFILSGRRTYADMFLALSKDDDLRDTRLYFYDFNLKTNFRLNENNRIFLSGYFGRDNFKLGDEFGFDWGNKTGTLRWNHTFGPKLFSNTSLIASNYSYVISIFGDYNVSIRSEIHDWNLKQDFTLFAGARNTLKFGGNLIYHNILPGEFSAREGSVYNPEKIAERKALEWAFYLSNNQSVSERIKLYYGMRLAMFSNLGPGEFYEFGPDGSLEDTRFEEKGKVFHRQGGIEPRLGMSVMLNEKSSIKSSYNRIYQFLHLLSNSTTTAPTDLWLPSSNNVKPQISDQISVGYFRNLRDNEFESSVEIYYKDLKNQIEYKNGAELVFNSTVEAELVFGRGWAYGAEFLFRRNYGRLSGWISYTLARTMRQFSEINDGRAFPARQDRTHDISVVGMYDLTEKLKFSATWVYYTGNAVTFPSGRYEIDGRIVGYYTERNGYRMPDYHRLDLGFTWLRKKSVNFESEWNFSVYNAYARENAYYIDFRESESNPGLTEAVQVALFKMIPSVSYRFKF